jgi:hypothetical protein
VRNWFCGILFVVLLTSASFARSTVLKAAAFPEPGVLFALGTGLVGLATLVRRHFSK